VLAAKDLSGHDVSRYGVMDVSGDPEALMLRGIVEKPAPGTEPSHLVSLGRYLYTPDLFPLLAEGWARFEAAGEGREFYPMEALCTLAERGRVAVEVARAPHYDTGAPHGYLKTVIAHGLADERFGQELRSWLVDELGS
jgi:UTP--glucose-1-phosphate uridylyltransferase